MSWDLEIKSGDTLSYTFDLSDATESLDLTDGWTVIVTMRDSITGELVVEDAALTVIDADTVEYDPNVHTVLTADGPLSRDLFAEFDITKDDDLAHVPTHGYFVIHIEPDVRSVGVPNPTEEE